MTEEKNIVRLAEERAEAYAPRPKQSPVLVGLMAGLAAYLMVFVFVTAAGLGAASNYSVAHLITVVIAFGIAFAYVWHQVRAHDIAVMRELQRLEAEQDTQKAPNERSDPPAHLR